MKNMFKFFAFLLYTIIIFMTKHWEILLIEFAINILGMLLLKTNILKALKSLLSIAVLLLIMFAANALIVDLEYASLISVKLILVCNITYVFSQNISLTEFANVIEKLCMPLKIIKINPQDVSLIMCIAIAFIPILKNEFLQIKNVIKVKGYKLKLTNSSIILRPFFTSIFERVNQVSNSLRAKAYNE